MNPTLCAFLLAQLVFGSGALKSAINNYHPTPPRLSNSPWSQTLNPVRHNQQLLGTQSAVDQDSRTSRCGFKISADRIIDGSSTDDDHWPWMAALMLNRPLAIDPDRPDSLISGFFCGGALISSRHVITAAHCLHVVMSRPSTLDVWLGLRDIAARFSDASARRHSAALLLPHPLYNQTSGGNGRHAIEYDIGLIVLDSQQPITRRIGPVCLPGDNHDDFAGRLATLVGWGYYDLAQPSYSDTLLKTRSYVISSSYCRSVVAQSAFPSHALLCTAPSSSQTACRGDSGGPLMIVDSDLRWKLIGVVNIGGCQTSMPTAFARVASYLDFVRAAMEATLQWPFN